MVIHFVGSIEHFLSVRGFAGNIVHGMNEQNEIILHRIVILYDFIVKFFQQVFILQGRGTELHQKVLGTPGFLRCQGKFHSEEIFTHRAGKGFAEVYDWAEKNKLRVHHWFFSTDLTSYKRGGRISATSAMVGTLLGICPLLNMDNEGHLIPRKKIRTKKKVIEELVNMMKEHVEDGPDYKGYCYISNSACEEDAEKVRDLVEAYCPNLKGKVLINSIGTVIGSHTGPGTVALFFLGDERVD